MLSKKVERLFNNDVTYILRHKDKDIQSNVHNESAGNLYECLCISPLSVGGSWVSSS